MIYSIPLMTLALLLVPAGEFLITAHQQIHALAETDRSLAEIADSTTQSLNALAEGNQELLALQAACPAALLTGAGAAALETEGQVVMALQMGEQAELLARLESAQIAIETFVETPSFWRLPPGPCNVPGLLEWPTTPSPFARVQKRRGGIEIYSASTKTSGAWNFANKEVLPL